MEEKDIKYVPCVPQGMVEEDEIDLKELIKTILKYKWFIIIFTIFMTLLAGVYVFLKTPIYETKHTFLLAQVNGKPIRSPKVVKEYLSGLYKYDLAKKFKKMPKAYLSDIKIPKNSDSFIIVSINGLSNAFALKKRDEILKNLQKINESVVEENILSTKQRIKDLQFQLKKIDIFEIPNTKQKIKNLQFQLKAKKEMIDFYKKQLKTIENKIKFLDGQIKLFSKKLKDLSSNEKGNDLANLIISNKILSYRNLIFQYYSQIQDLNLKKEEIISHFIPQLNNQIKNIENQIDKLNLQIKTVFPQKKIDIENQIKQLQLSLNNTFNTKEIGKPLILDHPVKPKKKLIIAVAFITGLILSIFLVFFFEFIKGLKEDDNNR